MSLPEVSRVELPILQELDAVGGADQVRFLYDRLVRYFPQWIPDEGDGQALERRRWQALIQRAGRQLSDKGEVLRDRTRWSLTARGRRRLASESVIWSSAGEARALRTLSHRDVQDRLVELGRLMGRHAEAEFEHFDVVWRDSAGAPRLSHVFEVQIAGNVDSALTRLRQAWEQWRSRLFLVLADERSARFAQSRLVGAFHDIADVVALVGVGEVEQLHRSLSSHEGLFRTLAARG